LPAPSFDDTFAVEAAQIVGGKHLRLTLARPDGHYEAMLFQYAGSLPARIRAAFRPEVNDWQGLRTLQLTIEHWEPA
jgi:single-stranded-DNA-specific exonuclease